MNAKTSFPDGGPMTSVYHALSALPVVALLALSPKVQAAPDHTSKTVGREEPARSSDWCGTMPAIRFLDDSRSLARTHWCRVGPCDTASVRDATRVFPITIRLVTHVMRDDDGSGGVSQQDVDDTITKVNADFAAYDIDFINTTLFHDDSRYSCLPAFHPDSTGWAEALQQMKLTYAETPDEACNIFIACMEASPDTLRGLGTLPWEDTALDALGGIWLNADLSIGGETRIATHELGHCLGLWHTHAGVSEVTQCGHCYEFVERSEADLRGDLCSDTRSTPPNYVCADPAGGDCHGSPWGATPYRNHMGYSRPFEDCANEFTPQQTLRMHCWTKDVLLSWIAFPPTGVASLAVSSDSVLSLEPSHPNPFSPRTVLKYSLPDRRRVNVTVHDVLGRRVHTLIDGTQVAGSHSVTWDGRSEQGVRVSAGIYFVRLRADHETRTQKVVLIQ